MYAPPCPPALRLALQQLDGMLSTFGSRFPDDTSSALHYQLRKDGAHPLGANVGWTTGFWPGMLWLGYELTGRERFRDAAADLSIDFQRRLEAGVDLEHHDLGFLYLLSNVAADRITGLPGARATAVAAADRLMARLLPGASVIQAWGRLDDPTERGRVIIDSVMNLPLLHWAHSITGRAAYREAARSHLLHTMDFLLRPDGSTCQTYFVDADTGAPRRPATHQGLSDSSCWSRGQAWALYGLALNHHHLPDLGLLDRAMQVADYFLSHLPPDDIALWDLNLAHDSGEPRDSSANAIAVCGLLELANQLPEGPARKHYQEAGERLLGALTRHCAGALPTAGGLLAHGTYHRLANRGVDECTLWGDYYYLEALARLHKGWTSYDR